MDMSGAVRVSAGVAAVIAGLAGCATPPPALGSRNAQVTIDGRDTGTTYPVSCDQFGWDWKLHTLKDTPGFTAMFTTGDPSGPQSVQIRDLGGFTGSYWKYTTGDAKFRIDNGDFVLTGTAVGYTSDRPNKTSSATFMIRTDC
ncbi:hypothetical protein DVS77_28820 [Mycolicibacterium moriokaense]|nr:hypothetical protein DVS77_28820 [Mycolicibacterium moriokaense]